MALQQKERLLSMGNVHRLAFKDLGGRKVLYIQDAPYEFEDIIYRWLHELPGRYKDAAAEECIVFSDERGMAITEDGWAQFIAWMTNTIMEVLNGQRPHVPIAEGDVRLEPDLLHEKRRYDRSGNSERIPGEWSARRGQVEP